MTPASAFLALAALSGAASPGPRCPEGQVPVFTGQPFLALGCRAQAPKGEPAEPTRAELPVLRGPTRSLKALAGRWEGLTFFNGRRFEVFCEIKKLHGRTYRVRLHTSDYETHVPARINADLKDGVFSAGKFSGEASLEALSEQVLKLKAWLGAPAAGTQGGFDREAVVSLGGIPDLHRLRLTLVGKDLIRYSYRHRDAAGRANAVDGELRPSTRSGL